MNYLDKDSCYDVNGNFTPNQIERMWRHYLLFREQVTKCSKDEKEIEVVILYDNDHTEDGANIRLTDLTEMRDILNTKTDVTQTAFHTESGKAQTIDVCVPKKHSFRLQVTEEEGDGFSEGGRIDVFVDRTLVETISGNFGGSTELLIPAMGKGGKAKSRELGEHLHRSLRHKATIVRPKANSLGGGTTVGGKFVCVPPKQGKSHKAPKVRI